MNNLIKLGFLALVLSAFLSACVYCPPSKDIELKDSIKIDSNAIDLKEKTEKAANSNEQKVDSAAVNN